MTIQQQIPKHAASESERFLEKALFSHRTIVLFLFTLMTVILASSALRQRLDASFEKMIPTAHPYVVNFLNHRNELKGLGNVVRIAVETTKGDIFQTAFLDTLKKITEEAFYIPGVNRGGLKSLWTPNMRWVAATEGGLDGGLVIPDTYDGSAASLEQVRDNVLKSGQVGRMIANNFKSTIVIMPLLERDPETGEPLDYAELSRNLESLLREKYQSETVRVHITGFAKVVGEMIDGASQVILFFAMAFAITLVLLFLYSRCFKSTLATLFCSLIAVVWQLGFLHLMGYNLDPYSMLVPFLVFAIGVSHGVQIVNAIAHGAMAGRDRMQAARFAFRSLYIAGITALVSDGIGFATLMVIDIGVVRDLALAASVGVAVIILTNLVLLPVIMSFIGVTPGAVSKLQKQEAGKHAIWSFLSRFTHRSFAAAAIAVAVLLYFYGGYASQELKIGDLDRGAPELRANSSYNLDNEFIVGNYSTSTDIFVVMAEMPDGKCISYDALAALDYFKWYIAGEPGVQSVVSLADRTKRVIGALSEGDIKWVALSRNQWVLNGTVGGQLPPGELFNQACNLAPVLVFLEDHKAETLQNLTRAIDTFNEDYETGDVKFTMAAGSAGIETATNEVVESAQLVMLVLVYAVVSFLVLLAFRSWRAVVCIVLPLSLTSILCQALMVYLGIGVKVATLPVIALGVGIGVDYGIYIFTKLESNVVSGMSLKDAYFDTLKSTGKAVVFTGLTLAIGVATWSLSPLKFQADMGVLLTFMFLFNMLGAVMLLPALARVLISPEKLRKNASAIELAEMSAVRSL